MPARGTYIPLHAHPSPSLANSRLFTFDFAVREPPFRRLFSRFPRLSLKSFAVTLISTVFLVVVLYPRKHLTNIQRVLAAEGMDYLANFDQLYNKAHNGWRFYKRKVITDHEQKGSDLSTWVDKLSDECVENLTMSGEICSILPTNLGGNVDALWTWSRTDLLLQRWRVESSAMMMSEQVSSAVQTVRMRKTARHFRDHDELRYSIRAALQSFTAGSLANLHLVSTDLPFGLLPNDTIPSIEPARIGQVPTWLTDSPSGIPMPLEIHHHSEFFVNKEHLPTFNSLSIESQLPYIQDIESEHMLYLNDDTFLLGEDSLSAGDIGAPILGSVFRVQSDLTVDGIAPDVNLGNPDGEWASLRRANWLLDRRFGRRERAYLAHIPKAMSLPILREIGMIWKEELEQTASSRFRGRETEYQLPFLSTHYTIESHRQALLHSFVVGRSDRDGDGRLSIEERKTMLEELGFTLGSSGSSSSRVAVQPARDRTTRHNLPDLLSQAGISRPRSTSIRFTSMDGYFAYASTPEEGEEGIPVCTIDFTTCFGENFLEASTIDAIDVLRRVAFERVECGDCTIAKLVSTSGPSGLASFLPHHNDEDSTSTPSTSTYPPLNLTDPSHAKDYTTATLTRPPVANRRIQAIREILRYSYVLGDSKSKFHGMQMPETTRRILKEVSEPEKEEDRNLTFLTLNDDFSSDSLSALTSEVLQEWFEKTFPTKSEYER